MQAWWRKSSDWFASSVFGTISDRQTLDEELRPHPTFVFLLSWRLRAFKEGFEEVHGGNRQDFL